MQFSKLLIRFDWSIVYFFSSFQKPFTTQLDDTADDINLVESQPNAKDTNKTKTNMWKTFGNIIDRFLFVLFSLAYFFMVIAFLPEKFLDEKDVTTVEIVGI